MMMQLQRPMAMPAMTTTTATTTVQRRQEKSLLFAPHRRNVSVVMLFLQVVSLLSLVLVLLILAISIPTADASTTVASVSRAVETTTTAPAQAPTSSSSSTNGTTPTTPTWSGCVDPKNPNAKLKRGDPTIVCIQLANGNNWASGNVYYKRLSFQPEADEYSRFHIPNSYRDLVASASQVSIFNQKSITVGVASGTALSFLRVFFDYTSNPRRIYPYLTAIIDVRRGVPVGITWDDACVFCGGLGGSECTENTFNYNGVQQTQETSKQPTKGCSLREEDCNTNLGSNNTVCDLTVYVVWTGTDASGKALLSSANRFSQFPKQSISDRFQSSLPSISNPLSGNKNTTTREL